MTGHPRKPGRPSTGQTKARSVRVGPSWDMADRIAKSQGTSITQVIKAKLQQYIEEHTTPVVLAPEREAIDHPAYLCGRLAAVLEELELAATGKRDAWYTLYPQTIAEGSMALRWADSRSAGWLKLLPAELATRTAIEIQRMRDRIGDAGSLPGAENGSWVSLGYFHQQAASDRANRLQA